MLEIPVVSGDVGYDATDDEKSNSTHEESDC